MRVLHTISGIEPRNGGPTEALTGLTIAQRRAGMDVKVISTWHEQEAFQTVARLQDGGVKVRMIGPAAGKLSRHPHLASAIREEVADADVVHVHALWEQIQHEACREAMRTETPYVVTPHGMLDPWNMRKNRFAKHLFLALRVRRNLNCASRLHCTTAIERDAVSRLALAPPIIVEPLGLRADEFNAMPVRGSFRKRQGWPEDRPIVLFLGRIHYGKGLELLVPALAKMARKDALLVVAGPDREGYGAVVSRTISRYGLDDRVCFTGMVTGEDRQGILLDADLLALPSFHENFGLVVIEALACGTAVVVSDQVNLHPYIRSNAFGGVTRLNTDELAAELDRWLEDVAARQLIRETAGPLVRRDFDWDTVANHWVGHYRELMG